MKRFLLGILLVVCSVVFMGTSDWKKCDTELIMANTQNAVVNYHVKWFDHDVKAYRGLYIRRCGGELQPYKMVKFGSDFRLCPGRHIVDWYKRNPNGRYTLYTRYEFIVTKDMTQVVLTPEVMKAK